MTTGEKLSQFRKRGIYPQLKREGGLRVIASTDDLSPEERDRLREELKEAAPSIRAYLVRAEWIDGRIYELFRETETLTPDAIDWNVHTDLERRLLQLL